MHMSVYYTVVLLYNLILFTILTPSYYAYWILAMLTRSFVQDYISYNIMLVACIAHPAVQQLTVSDNQSHWSLPIYLVGQTSSSASSALTAHPSHQTNSLTQI